MIYQVDKLQKNYPVLEFGDKSAYIYNERA